MPNDLPFWRQLISDRIEPFEVQYASKCDDVALQIEASTGRWPTYLHWEQFQRYVQSDAGRLTDFILGTDTDMARLVREVVEDAWVWDKGRHTGKTHLAGSIGEPTIRMVEDDAPTRVPGPPRCKYKLASGPHDLDELTPAVLLVAQYLSRVDSASIQTIMAECLLGRSTVMNAIGTLRQRQVVDTIPAGVVAA